jgi:hypothetical protein
MLLVRRTEVRECPIHGTATHSIEAPPTKGGEPPREVAYCLICQREAARDERDQASKPE